MKAVKTSQTKLRELSSIKILDNSYELSNLHYDINKKDYFEFIGTRLEYNNKFVTICLLKTITGDIKNNKFNYKLLDDEIGIKMYLRNQNNVKFINKLSLNFNNKKYYNFIEESGGGYPPP